MQANPIEAQYVPVFKRYYSIAQGASRSEISR